MKRYLLTVNENEFKSLIAMARAKVEDEAFWITDGDTDAKVMEPLAKALFEEAEAVQEQMEAQDRTEAIMNAPLSADSVRMLEEMVELTDGTEEDG